MPYRTMGRIHADLGRLLASEPTGRARSSISA